jgi:hypothetical protein
MAYSSILDEIVSSLKIEDLVTDEIITRVTENYAYQGMDLEGILKKIKNKLTSSEAKAQLTTLITIGLFRGNMIKKIKEGLTEENRRYFSAAIEKFEIKSSITSMKGKEKATVLTLSRLCIAVPQITAAILSKPNIIRPVGDQKIASVFNVIVKFPPVLRHLSMAGLIPKKQYSSFDANSINCALHLIIAYCYSESGVLVAKDAKQKSDNLRFYDIVSYIRTSWNSNHTSSDHRENFITKYNIANLIEPNRELINKVIDKAEEFEIDIVFVPEPSSSRRRERERNE